MSRPEKKIDWEIVDELLAAGSHGTDVAAFLGIHPDTFYKRVEKEFRMGFSDYSSKKKSVGDALIRLTQYKKAVGISKKGDNMMLIWLGKQRLNQKDNPGEMEISKETNERYLQVIHQITALQRSASVQSDQSSNLEE